MRLLLIEAKPGLGASVAERLAGAGHDVDACYDEVGSSPCRGVHDNATCPMHHPVDLTVVVRDQGMADTLLEMGAICAERYRVPVVDVRPDDADVVETVRIAAAAGKDRAEAKYASVVRSALAERCIAVEARRDPGCVKVRLSAAEPLTPQQRACLADNARAALRAFDPFVPVIDVSVLATSG
jgi:hypothetical protein